MFGTAAVTLAGAIAVMVGNAPVLAAAVAADAVAMSGTATATLAGAAAVVAVGRETGC